MDKRTKLYRNVIGPTKDWLRLLLWWALGLLLIFGVIFGVVYGFIKLVMHIFA